MVVGATHDISLQCSAADDVEQLDTAFSPRETRSWHRPMLHAQQSKDWGDKVHDQTFSARSLWRLLARGDRSKYLLGNTRDACRAKLTGIAHTINEPDFQFSKFKIAKQAHGTIYSTIRTEDEFAIRKANDNIKRHYGLKAADRNIIIPQVITLCRELKNCHLIKLDIEKFFESIDRDNLIGMLLEDSSLSYKTKAIVKKLFCSPSIREAPGLPRGLSISSTLAELYLSGFDSRCRRLGFCYYFVRYVDDMLFFCHDIPADITDVIGSLLPKGLTINAAKTSIIDVDAKGILRTTSKNDRLSYLGYQFIFPSVARQKMKISIPPKKISKIKTRVILALRSFIASRDYQLLLNRIKFLTGNFRLKGSKESGRLYSGVFYNHQHIDLESRLALSEIDDFVRRAIFSRKGSLGRNLYPLITNEQRRQLCANGLRIGYEMPVFRNFTNTQLRKVKEAWSYA